MEHLRDQFLAEGRELVQAASDDLAALARQPDDAERIDALFRALHTLKGSSGLFDLKPLGDMLHAAEDLIDALRKRRLASSARIVGLLIECVDRAAHWLDAFEARGSLPPDAAQVGNRLQSDLRDKLAPDDPAVRSRTPDTADQAWAEVLAAAYPELDRAGLVAIRYVPREDCFFAGDDPLAILRTVPGLCALSIGARQPWGPLGDLDPFRCNLAFEALTHAAGPDVQAALHLVGDQVEIVGLDRIAPSAAPIETPAAAAGGRSLRVEVERIDALAHVADELVTANNALADLAAQARRGVAGEALVQGVVAAHLELDRLIASLHRSVARVRLVPLSGLFQRFPRHIREMAGRLGKGVALATAGDGIEIDKSLVDGLFEPMIHVLRNAVDHGIEPPEARRQAGKPPDGAIRLSARGAGDQVVLEIADDGRGIDAARIRRTVRARGLLPAAALDALTDEQAVELVFLPGFSTAGEVTDLSGRGVGMDAVRSAIERLGGRATIASTVGAGTTVRFVLPASVVLSSVIVVGCAGDLFGVPMGRVIETVRVARDRILPVRAGQAIVLRDMVVPVFELAALLGLSGAVPQADARLVVVHGADGPVAILVDQFADRLNLLLRPMSGFLANVAGVAGTAVLADGRVLMILDLAELIG